MKAKLISTTNHGMSHHAGISGILEVRDYAQWLGGARNQTFSTSAIVSHTLEGSLLALHTLNSVYVFEIIAGEFDASLLETPPQWLIDEHKQRNGAKHLEYLCQIMGSPSIDNAISLVRLPYAMNLQEARDYVAFNILKTADGDIVTHILIAK